MQPSFITGAPRARLLSCFTILIVVSAVVHYIYPLISTSLDTQTHAQHSHFSDRDGEARCPRHIVVSLLCLGLALFASQPVAAHGPRGGWKHTIGGKKIPVKETSGGKQEAPRDTVKRVVAEAINGNKRIGAALIRLVFHDCWVKGCDGSVLLDSKPYVFKGEKEAANNIGLDGFDVIDKIKSQLAYPENVSCADIVVLAAREATFIVSRQKIDYKVEMGRMDGMVSSAADADAVLPLSTFDVEQLKKNFGDKKFTTTELVALTGAHAVGVAHRSSFADRINATTATPISPEYMKALNDSVEEQKKVQGTKDPIEPNNIRDMSATFQRKALYDPTDVDTSATGVLDNSFYHNEEQNMVLFRSDWELRTDGTAGNDIDTFKNNPKIWYQQFGDAMAKLSKLPAEGTSFEIRKNCRKTNY